MIIERFGVIPFGGDYCPEQWDEATLQEDMRLIKQLGVNTVTINVHAWVQTQPAEGVYDFSFLDRTVRMLKENGLRIIMGTSTTAVPNWLGKKYPEVILADNEGRRHTPGTRENYCANSPVYRREIHNICSRLAEHFQNEESIKMWHMANELGHVCYCENCAAAFREKMRQKFGTLKRLNDAWYTSMWGHTYTAWEQIDPPTILNEYYTNINPAGDCMHSLPTEAIEYLRFYSDSIRECFEIESAAIKSFIPDAVVTNNFQFRTLDFHRASAASDIVSFDSYPSKYDSPDIAAFNYDIIRCIQTPGKPFFMMEMSPNQGSWEAQVALKRPGQAILDALKGIGHGADASMFFQIRKSKAGFEKFHGAMIDHVGHVDTRTGREMQELGRLLQNLTPYLSGTNCKAEVALVMDFDNKSAVEADCGPQKKVQYMDEVRHYYRYFHAQNIPVDVVQADASFDGYKLLIAPMFYMVRKETAARIRSFVESGGIFITGYYSGIADENDAVYMGGYPGAFRDLMGIWVEESDALRQEECNPVKMDDGSLLSCGYLCDLIHTEGAKTLGVYTQDFYAGMAAVTENTYGKGKAVYIGTKPDADGVAVLLARYAAQAGVKGILCTPPGVECCMRTNGNNALLFILNNTGSTQTVSLGSMEADVLYGAKIENSVLELAPKASSVLCIKRS